MFVLVLLILLGVVALGLFGASVGLREGLLAGGGAAVLVLVLLILTFGGMKSVPVKSIGIPQEFGTVSGSVMGPGVHWTFQPWKTVTDVDETVQTTTFEGNSALAVRIGGQQSALADATIQWQINPSAAPALYQDYANQGNLMATITNAVVVREFKQVVNQVLGDYNPITDVQNVSGSSTATSQFTQFGPTILADMRADIGSKITVDSVFLPKITYDQAVENALQSIQTANADYAVATEQIKTAHQQSSQYAQLGDPTMTQLIAECLVEAKTNTNLQCIPGATSNLALSGSSTSK